ncbi:hypothetical protein IFM89_026214 [Coptis chinensis]|uniref:XPG N-terminal domain-containing protein n=1 Tax=Coptis chinensis TaxID=261450 RepID=A0A835H6V6_9MAGN|nr:hypothetical protein IFM89_026214 [Coptis chinensis]
MGIKGLTKLLAIHAPNCKKEQTLESYAGCEIAIDASTIIYQFLIVVGRNGTQLLTNDAGEVTRYVFDGKPPDIKKQELAKRYLKRMDAAEDLAVAIESGVKEDTEKYSKRTVKQVTVAPAQEVQLEQVDQVLHKETSSSEFFWDAVPDQQPWVSDVSDTNSQGTASTEHDEVAHSPVNNEHRENSDIGLQANLVSLTRIAEIPIDQAQVKWAYLVEEEEQDELQTNKNAWEVQKRKRERPKKNTLNQCSAPAQNRNTETCSRLSGLTIVNKAQVVCIAESKVKPMSDFAYKLGLNSFNMNLLHSDDTNRLGNILMFRRIGLQGAGPGKVTQCHQCFVALAKEVLNRGLTFLRTSDMINRMCSFNGTPGHFHLLFADDVYIFANGHIRGLRNLADLLRRYQDASGQDINKGKSKLFMGCFPLTMQQCIQDLFGMTLGSLPVKYLFPWPK